MTDELSAQELRDLADAVDAANAIAAGRIEYIDEPAELPPPPDSEPMVMRGVRLPVSLDQQVRAAAAKAGMSFSALVREWIELGLTEMEDDKTIPLSALRRAIAHATQTGHAA
jgi:chromosomal replication initiator protein